MSATNKVLLPIGVLLAASALAFVAGSAAAGDWQYIDRSDKIDPDAGNAVAHNRAVQTIDPWARHAFRDRINIDGERMALAHRRYQRNKSIEPKGLNASSTQFNLLPLLGVSGD